MSSGVGLFKQVWFRWKSLKLPWRRQFLIGSDLAGNTFWEFQDALNSNRWRRIVKNSRRIHYSNVQISPQWHQWLRHTRLDPPSIEEQQYDVSRQAILKQLAAKADERWQAVPSFLDPPARQQAQPAMQIKDPAGSAPQTEPEEIEGVTNHVETPEKVQEVSHGKDTKTVDEGRFKGKTREREPAPWEKDLPKGAPSENWQPQAWSPGPAGRR